MFVVFGECLLAGMGGIMLCTCPVHCSFPKRFLAQQHGWLGPPVLCHILVLLGNVPPSHGGSLPEGHIPAVLRVSSSPATPPGYQLCGWGSFLGCQVTGMWDLSGSFMAWGLCLHSKGLLWILVAVFLRARGRKGVCDGAGAQFP